MMPNSNIEERDDEDETNSQDSEVFMRNMHKSEKELKVLNNDNENKKFNKEEVNISFQNEEKFNNNTTTKNEQITSDKSYGKQFTLQGMSPNLSSKKKQNIQQIKEFDNPINMKLKNLEIENNDEHLEDFINSLSQGQNSLDLNDDKQVNVKKNNNVKDNNTNMLSEINGKNIHAKVNSTIFKR
jgi:hypothetical protein